MNCAKQSTAKTFLVGPILDAAGAAKTDEVVASIKVTKNGTVGAVDAQDTLTHNHTGHYLFASDGGDFDTLGEVEFSLNSGTNAMAAVKFQVVSGPTYDALVTTSVGVTGGLATYDNVSNIAITGSPAYTAAGSYTPTNGTETLTYAATDTSNAVYHQIASVAGGIDGYYEYTLSADEVAVSVLFKGRITNSTKSCVVQAYDWVTPGWVTLFTLAGTNGTTDTSQSPALVAKYTGTGNDIGKVRIRVYTTNTSATLYVDQAIIGKTITNRSVGYADGSIWVDTVNGVAGTAPFTNGTADNPVLTWADAKTLSTSTGITSFHFLPGSSITLDSTAANYRFIGNAIIALGGQSIDKALFKDCYTISGTSTGDDAVFTNCGIGTASVLHCYFIDCRFKGTLTMLTGATTDWYFLNCHDATPGGSAAAATFVCVAGGQAMFRNWRGGIQLNNHKATNDTVIDGAGRLVIDAGSTAGDITIRGDFPPATGAAEFVSAGGTITQTQRYGTDVVITDTAGTTELLTRVPDATAGDAGGITIVPPFSF